jgi:hypothetical protein
MTTSERVDNTELIKLDKDKIVEVWKQMGFQCTHIDVANECKAVEIPLGPKTIGRLQERADQEALRDGRVVQSKPATPHSTPHAISWRGGRRTCGPP